MDFKATNEQLTPNQLNDLIKHLEKTIPVFPKLGGKTVSYDYEADIHIISLTWEGGYHISEDHVSEDNGYYILDLNYDRRIIGVELLNFKIVNTLN